MIAHRSIALALNLLLFSTTAIFSVSSATAAIEVKLPPFSKQTLPNGAVVYLMPRKDVPLALVRVYIKGGAESDPANLAGLASVTADLLRRGTEKRSADEFSNDLDFLGASFTSSSDAQKTEIEVEFLAKDAARAIELLRGAVLTPTFPEDEVKKALAQRLDSAKAVKDSPNAAIGNYFRAFLFGNDHPYGHPRSGDELSLAKMTRDDIAGFHKRMYVGSSMVIIAAGDFNQDSMLNLIKSSFGSAPKGTPYDWKADKAPPKPSEAQLLLVDKPDATQTNFLIGHSGIKRTSQERTAILLVNTLFGGRFTSILNDELRVNSGLTYGARSSFEQNRLTGAFYISSFTATPTTEKALDLTFDILKRFRENGITAEQLESAKAYTKGMFPPDNLETADQLAEVLADLEIFGLNRGEIDDLFSRIDAVTLEQANAAIKKYFGSESLRIVLVGNAAQIRDEVKKYAPKMNEVSISTPGYPTSK